MRGRTNAPRSLTVIAVLAIAWNLVGIAAFAVQAGMSDAQMTALPPAQQQAWREMPGWAWVSYAIAVFAGTAGAVALLLRRSAAVALLGLSLAAVILQYGYSFLVARLASMIGPQALLLPLVIIVLAVAQLLYARHARVRGWLG